MIKINLLGDSTVKDTSGAWVLLSYGLALLITVVTCALVQSSISSQVDALLVEKESLERRVAQLKEQTKDVAGLESMRADLAAKTTVITQLKHSKLGPVRVLDDLNTALPERSWLTEISEASGSMQLVGLALDNQTIAQYMEKLEPSDFLDKVDLLQARQVDHKGVKVKEFTLKMNVNYASIPKPAEKKVEGAEAGAVAPVTQAPPQPPLPEARPG